MWTALPNGSKIEATSSSMPGQWCQMFVIGSDDVLGERAGAVDAEADRVRAEVAPAGHAVAAAAADDVALAADEVAGGEVAHVRADLDHLADELVADHHRHGDRLRCAQSSQLVDVQVGAADPGPVHPDQDVVDADLGLGDVLSQSPGLPSRLPSARISPFPQETFRCRDNTRVPLTP